MTIKKVKEPASLEVALVAMGKTWREFLAVVEPIQEKGKA